MCRVSDPPRKRAQFPDLIVNALISIVTCFGGRVIASCREGVECEGVKRAVIASLQKDLSDTLLRYFPVYKQEIATINVERRAFE